jgi:hypothetical protein
MINTAPIAPKVYPHHGTLLTALFIAWPKAGPAAVCVDVGPDVVGAVVPTGVEMGVVAAQVAGFAGLALVHVEGFTAQSDTGQVVCLGTKDVALTRSSVSRVVVVASISWGTTTARARVIAIRIRKN